MILIAYFLIRMNFGKKIALINSHDDSSMFLSSVRMSVKPLRNI